MANEKEELEIRLYVMANLAHKTSSFYHRDYAKLDKGRIKAVLEDLSEGEIISKLDTFIKEYDATSPLSMIVVHSILSIKLQQANDENISQLYEKTINKYTKQKDNIAEVLAEKLIEIGTEIDIENK